MKVTTVADAGKISWRCFDKDGRCWLSVLFEKSLEIINCTDTAKAVIIQRLLKFIRQKKPACFKGNLQFRFDLDFDRMFGFGTSSTLIALLSQWSGVDAYELSAQSFFTSGYDVAAATAKYPFIYSMQNRLEQTFAFPEGIVGNLLFVYLGDKQSTFSRVKSFNQLGKGQESDVQEMNRIVDAALACKNIEEWEKLMEESEQLLSPLLNMEPVQKALFDDYPFKIKSLGAWGGDFIMATCRDVDGCKRYFTNKNKSIFFTFSELIK